MSQVTPPRLSKWPFVIADTALVIAAAWVVYSQPHPLSALPVLAVVLAMVAAAWLGVLPFLVEYRALLKYAESDNLNTTVAQIGQLQAITNHIRHATGQWQSIQEQCTKATSTAQDMGNRLVTEARAFQDFMARSQDAEKTHLRLEVEKFQRNERELVEMIVRLMDHVYALYQAGNRSGQRNIIDQLTTFQRACRETIRRVGLLPYEVETGARFDPEKHQSVDETVPANSDSKVLETLATGFTFQGQLVRPALVRLEPSTDGSNLPTPTEPMGQNPDPRVEDGPLLDQAGGSDAEPMNEVIETPDQPTPPSDSPNATTAGAAVVTASTPTAQPLLI